MMEQFNYLEDFLRIFADTSESSFNESCDLRASLIFLLSQIPSKFFLWS